MSNPTVVERMARALFEVEHERLDTSWELECSQPGAIRDYWIKSALAALEALRVPSEGMKRAGVDADDKRTGNETCAHIYEAMISAAISEHKGK